MISRQVLLSEAAEGELAMAAADAVPHEMVGLLAGQGGPAIRVERFVRVAAATCTADRFTLPAAAFAAAEAAIRAGGERWLGFAHSHPGGSASLSTRDRAELWRGCLQLVVSPRRDGTAEIGAFWIEQERIDMLRIVRTVAAAP